MKAFLLTAGLGTRLRPLTDNMPKCLLPINGKPLLQIWLELLSRNGVDQVLINTHWHHEKVEAFAEEIVNGYPLLVDGEKDRDQMSEVRCQRSGKDRREDVGKDRVNGYPLLVNGKENNDRNLTNPRITNQQITNNSLTVRLFYEPELLGSAGTLLANRNWVDDGEPFFILYGDNLTNVDLGQMYDFHYRSPLPLTLGVFKTHEPERCGIADVNENGVVVDFVEKPENPKSNLAHAGINIADNRIFDFFPEDADSIRPLDLGFHVIPNLVGNMKAYFIDEFLMDIGTSESYEKAQAIWSR